jgi:hypothetical protein
LMTKDPNSVGDSHDYTAETVLTTLLPNRNHNPQRVGRGYPVFPDSVSRDFSNSAVLTG